MAIKNYKLNLFSRRDVLKKLSSFVVFSFAMAKNPLKPAISFAAGNNNNSILSLRLGEQNGGLVRFVIESSSKIDVKTSFIENPARIVIDVYNSNISNMSDTTKKTGFIDKIRYYAKEDNRTRIVLDLNKKAEILKNFTIEPTAGKAFREVFDMKLSSKSAMEGDMNSKKKDEKRVYTVVIDAGHGGRDPGAIGYSKTKEKDIVLLIAKNIRNQLNKEKNFKVIMTRTTDKYLKLKNRASVSDKNNADLFISVHADANKNKKARGLSVYSLSEKASDEEARKLAEKENAADLMGVGHFDDYEASVRNILGELTQMHVKEASMEFANNIVTEVKRNNNVRLLGKPHRQAPFAVLKSSVPSVLIEAGFVSNKKEEKLLNNLWYRTEISKSIKNAIKKQLAVK